MTPLNVDGAHPRRAETAVSSSTGSTPRLDAAARARATELAATFTAQIEQSMMQSLAALSAAGEDEAGGEEDGGGSDDGNQLGLDGDTDQAQLMATIFSGAQQRGMTTAQTQALMASMGGMGAGGRAVDTAAGAGDEARTAQQLLATLSGNATQIKGAPAVAPADNARTVAAVAQQHGVDPVAAVAMMLVESGGNNRAVGDGGTSFGLFQLHEGGMLTAAGLSSTQAFDPSTNAQVALTSYAHEHAKGHVTRTPGQIAAASQRPADPVGYAAKVDAMMDRARALLA